MNDVTYREITEFFGTERQSRQAMEECAELIQAINKCLRYPDDEVRRLDLIEEMADVKIMILQLEEIYGVSLAESSGMFAYKKARLIQKYEQERQKEREEE